jgi:MFS transporter, YNFM family, putative membrane transport protein
MSQPATAGSPAYHRINRAMLYAGLSAFALLYCVQPLLPEMSHHFALTPAQSSWTLSISTLFMALALLLSGPVSERVGRKPLMVASLVGAAVLTLLSALARDFTQLLVLRALLGFALGGMPAVAMAYLGTQIEKSSLGVAMGMYIGGSALGGMLGRVASSFLADHASWRWSMAVIGAGGLVAAWRFWRNLPAGRDDRAAEASPAALLRGTCRTPACHGCMRSASC